MRLMKQRVDVDAVAKHAGSVMAFNVLGTAKRWGLAVWSTLRATVDRWNHDDGWLLSAAMAYSAAFSLFPLCLILIAGLSWVSRMSPALHARRIELVEIVRQNAGPWVADQLHGLLQGVDMNAGYGGPLGIATLGIGAIGIFLQFDAIFDRIWNTTAEPITGFFSLIHRLLIDRIAAFIMLVALGVLLIGISIANFAADGVKQFVDTLPAGAVAWSVIQPGIALAVNAVVFTLIYKFLPKVRVGFLESMIGGVFVSIVWQIGTHVLTRIVISSKYSAYGVVGSFVAIMAWMYYASIVIFLGAELVQVIWRKRHGMDITDAPCEPTATAARD
jgi:membrane protein